MRAGRLLDAFVDLLAPLHCPGCDLPRPRREHPFCDGCAPLLERPDGEERPPSSAAAAYLYAGPLADALCRFKYGGRTDFARPLAALLAAAALPYAGKIDRVMPLPLHPARLRERGFNQSALLARPVAQALGVTLDTASLRRVRPTRDQAGLPREGRAENVRGAFVAKRPIVAARILLIDDVRTTGATLAAGAAALLDAGFVEVRTLALARAVC